MLGVEALRQIATEVLPSSSAFDRTRWQLVAHGSMVYIRDKRTKRETLLLKILDRDGEIVVADFASEEELPPEACVTEEAWRQWLVDFALERRSAFLQERREKISEKISEWVRGSLLLGGAVGVLWGTGAAVRAAPLAVLAVWVLLPGMAWLANTTSLSASLTLKGLERARVCLMVAAVALSLALALNWDHLRDRLGRAIVPGYRVRYHEYVAEDELGRWGIEQRAEVHADHECWKLALWAVGGGLIASCVAVPWLTWKGITRAVETRRREAGEGG